MIQNTLTQNVFWYTQKPPAAGAPLSGTVEADVVVVGGGMAGLMCAHALRKAGKNVVLIEREFCGAGASGKTSGFITPDSEIELSSLLSTYGPQKAKQIWEFVRSGVTAIRRTIREFNIQCDEQVQDSLFIANTNRAVTAVKEEHAARQALAYESQFYGALALKEIIGSNCYTGAVRYPETFGMNAFEYCQAVRDAIIAAGVSVYEQTVATRVDGKGVDTIGGRINAKQVVVCADRFIPEFGVLQKEIYHVQTFLGISKPLPTEQIKMMFPKDLMMVWDTDLVYNYLRVAGGNRVLLGGGDLLYTYARTVSDNTQRFKRRLTAYFNAKFPAIALELEYVWPGMLGVSKDLLPVMGLDSRFDTVWYVGAATGLPWAAALGIYAAQRITEGRDEFDDIFSWKRTFVISRRIQTLLTTPITYALSHGIAKYF